MNNDINPKIRHFLDEQKPETPCLVVDMELVEKNYLALQKALPFAVCHYAVKSNPAEPILKLMVKYGAHFDNASLNEILMTLKAGAKPEQILFGNTIKKQKEIAEAYRLGVRLYTFDSPGELKKIAESAPGSKVFCRLATDNYGAAWPLSKKFGCGGAIAYDLMIEAKKLGLIPHGLSFHVGSQQLELIAWEYAIGRAAEIFKSLKEEEGIELKSLNMGGGFPARYRTPIPSIDQYGRAITSYLEDDFGKDLPEIIIEPGRYIAGDAGVLMAEVVLVSDYIPGQSRRWVYLDIGKFNGLMETEDIQYRIVTDKEDEAKETMVIAGPTCDSTDILYEKAHYELPLSLESGDKVYFLSAGAYTTTYAAVAFNGFPPPKDYYI